jgi:RHS repeat-associated protein
MTYNKANQLATASNGGSGTYGYDAFGQRLKVTVPGNPLQVYNYDLAGHLLAETNNSIEYDYVYLDGTPIALIAPAAATISYIHADRLGTPQKATNASKASVWSAQYQPFGSGTPSGTVTLPLRMPGQYADNTGYFHNGFRDYNPAIGRYLESDPIGLRGGANTYAYVRSNPSRWKDRWGLQVAEGDPTEEEPISEPEPTFGDDNNNGGEAPSFRTTAGIPSSSPLSTPVGGLQCTLDSPTIDPRLLAGMTPQEIDAEANRMGLIPMGPDPMNGRGAYVDPFTGQQRILSSPNDPNPHMHVNDPDGNRLDINGNPVNPRSPAAHLPIGTNK